MYVTLPLLSFHRRYSEVKSPMLTVTVPDQSNSQIQIYPLQQNSNLENIPNSATTAVRNSDIMMYTWTSPGLGSGTSGPAFVQNQSLYFNFYGAYQSTNPGTPYPFTRLAWTNSTSASAVYFYHQLSDSILTEDAFYIATGWHTTNISIGTSS